jgi:L-ascorbate metabolism protein UlaG (beta-lactamase superfamily)
MAVKLTYYGHACFLVEGGGSKMIIDPFLTGNPTAPVGPSQVKVDYVLVSHAHGDHWGDTEVIARANNALVIANHEISVHASNLGLRAHGLHIGGGYNFPFGRVQLTPAMHGSSFPDGSYGGNPAGFLLTLEGKNIYHACDTGLFYDMKLIGEKGIDVAILPIGDNYTMGPDDALKAVQLIQPKVVIPIHYGTFDIIKQDPEAFKAAVESKTSAKCVILRPGDSLTL